MSVKLDGNAIKRVISGGYWGRNPAFRSHPDWPVGDCRVVLGSLGSKPLSTLRVYRAVTGADFHQAKTWSENLPNVVRGDVSLIGATEIADRFRSVGAEVEVVTE